MSMMGPQEVKSRNVTKQTNREKAEAAKGCVLHCPVMAAVALVAVMAVVVMPSVF